MSIFQSHKARATADMVSVYEHLMNTVKFRRDYAQSWADLGPILAGLFCSQMPSLGPSLDALSGLLMELSQVHTALADSEARAAEDWRDVTERFGVLWRETEEKAARIQHLNEATEALATAQARVKAESMRPGYEKIRFRFDQQLALAKANKADALQRCKFSVARLITVSRAYAAFKVRRFHHGWTLYATATRRAAQREMDIFGRITQLLDAAQIGPAVGGAIAHVAEQAPTFGDEQADILFRED
jgi:hypothetical protein